jgi:hypothetical protein
MSSILSTNHRERERQIENIKRVARGEKVEKKIYVQMEDLEEKKKREDEVKADRERRNDRMDALKEAKIPWFCPECDKVMKRKLDDKMFRLFNHCFDCQVKFENKLRIEGKYEEWEEKKVLNNKLSYVKDQIESIKDWKSQSFEFYNQVGVKDIELEKEKWNVNKKQIETTADEAIKEFEDIKVDLEKVLNN